MTILEDLSNYDITIFNTCGQNCQVIEETFWIDDNISKDNLHILSYDNACYKNYQSTT